MMGEEMKYSVIELRKANHLTQKQVASDFGISLTTYRHWEKNISELGVSKAVALAEYFGVHLGQLLFCSRT